MAFIVFEEEAFNYLDAQLENFVKRMDRIRERSEDKAMSQWLDTQDVCQILNICPRTVQTLRDNGTLAYTQISHKTYYKPEDVTAIVAKVEDKQKDLRFRNNKMHEIPVDRAVLLPSMVMWQSILVVPSAFSVAAMNLSISSKSFFWVTLAYRCVIFTSLCPSILQDATLRHVYALMGAEFTDMFVHKRQKGDLCLDAALQGLLDILSVEIHSLFHKYIESLLNGEQQQIYFLVGLHGFLALALQMAGTRIPKRRSAR